MAAPCTYGASVKSGVDPDTWVPIDKSLYNVLSVVAPWWLATIGQIWIPTEMQVSDLCALNPEDPSLPSAFVIANAIIGVPSALVTVNNYIKNKLTYLAFQLNCTCDPAPGEVCTYGANACYAVGHSIDVQASGWVQGDGLSPYYIACTAGDVVTLSWSGSTLNGGSAGDSVIWAQQREGGGGEVVIFAIWDSPQAFPGSHTYTIPTTGNYWFYLYTNANSAGYCIQDLTLSAPSCAGSPTTPPDMVLPTQPTTLVLPDPPTCGNYQDICNVLQQLTMKIDFLIRSQPRQIYTTSVSEGTSHTGLTGIGTISVGAILGLRVSLTTIPAHLGSETAEPTFYFDVGFINFHTAEGWRADETITRADTRLDVPAGTDQIGYTLRSGVVATITELTRGP